MNALESEFNAPVYVYRLNDVNAHARMNLLVSLRIFSDVGVIFY